MDALLDFSNKSVLITGAASGFGRLLSIALASRGAGLILADFNAAGLADTVETVKGLGAKVASATGDVSREAHAKELVDLAMKTFGKLDIAVNNAGVGTKTLGSVMDLDEETLNQQLDVNVKGVAWGMKYQIQAMLPKKDGVILNVSSMAGLGSAPGVSSYSAAKHAVIGLTKTAAVEFGKYNIRANAICPFFAHTPMVDDSELAQGGTQEDTSKQLGRGCPMKRIARPEEIVNVMVMMLSPANTYMNGVALPVDGGVLAV